MELLLNIITRFLEPCSKTFWIILYLEVMQIEAISNLGNVLGEITLNDRHKERSNADTWSIINKVNIKCNLA